MAKCSSIMLSSVQIRPDKSLLFLLKWQAFQLRLTGEIKETCNTEAFLVSSALPEDRALCPFASTSYADYFEK